MGSRVEDSWRYLNTVELSNSHASTQTIHSTHSTHTHRQRTWISFTISSLWTSQVATALLVIQNTQLNLPYVLLNTHSISIQNFEHSIQKTCFITFYLIQLTDKGKLLFSSLLFTHYKNCFVFVDFNIFFIVETQIGFPLFFLDFKKCINVKCSSTRSHVNLFNTTSIYTSVANFKVVLVETPQHSLSSIGVSKQMATHLL